MQKCTYIIFNMSCWLLWNIPVFMFSVLFFVNMIPKFLLLLLWDYCKLLLWYYTRYRIFIHLTQHCALYSKKQCDCSRYVGFNTSPSISAIKPFSYYFTCKFIPGLSCKPQFASSICVYFYTLMFIALWTEWVRKSACDGLNHCSYITPQN